MNRREIKKYNGSPPPESRLYGGMVGGLLVPIGKHTYIPCQILDIDKDHSHGMRPLGLFWFAFTVYPHVHWIVPILASIPFGCGVILCFTSVFTFLVSTYRSSAASVMASNAFLRLMLCVAFPLIARPMFRRMGNVGAMALLAGLTLAMAPLP